MSNAFDKASLVMLPHAYEEGKLYSLKPTDRSGDFTFSRGTDTATRVNASGNIEKETQNLLLYSNTFSNANWVKKGTTITSGQSGYDGSNDASLLLSTTTGFPRVQQDISASGVLTYSVYLKEQNDSFALLRTYGATAQVWFDLTDGSVASETGDNVIDSSIADVGNGWYRASVTISGSLTQLRIYPASAYGTYSTASNGIYIQDAQLNPGLVAYPYLETTTAPVYGGLTDDMPRLDYSGGATCPSLLLEPSRTNLIAYSEYFGGQVVQNLTLTTNDSTSPEGLTNATLLEPAGSTAKYIDENITGAGTYTQSYFFKKGATSGYPALNLYGNASNDYETGVFDFDSKTFYEISGSATSFTNVSYDYEDYGNGWFRIWQTFTASKASQKARLVIFNEPTPTVGSIGQQSWTANGESFSVWGWQAEAGSYPTSYIPTYGSSQTRAAEKVYKNNAQSLIGQDEGTIYLEWVAKKTEDVYSMFKIDNGTSLNRLQFTLNQGKNPRFGFYYVVDGVNAYTSVNNQDLTEGTTYKSAVKYTQTSLVIYLNGTKIVDYTNFNVSNGVFSEIAFGNGAGSSSFLLDQPVKKVLLYKEPLDNNKLEALTTA